ncbi:MAG: intermembrane phospholipid transport protein YdbH family protein [Erythrobacter sp.]
MNQTDEPDLLPPAEQRRARWWPRRWPGRVLVVCALLLLVSGSATWLERERILGNLIDGYLADNGVEATYRLVEITPARQVIADLVVGDPAQPDLTAQQVVVEIGLGLLGPSIDRVVIDKARLFGTYRSGQVSLGALDPLVFTGSDQPASLPALNVALIDARARIDTDFGSVAAKLDGAGRLDDGFAGKLAVTAPGIGTPDCRAKTATLFGALTSAKGAPRLAGPLRLRGLECAGIQLARADVGSALTLAAGLDGVDAKFAIEARQAAGLRLTVPRISGTAKAAFSGKGIALEHDLAFIRLAAPQASVGTVTAAGTWRSGAPNAPAGARSEWNGRLAARDLVLADSVKAALATAGEDVSGTLLEPLLAQFSTASARALEGGEFKAEAIIRQTGDDLRLIIPEARLRSGTGETVLAVSQINLGLNDGTARGSLMMGGAGLPAVNARIEERAGAGLAIRLAMADYSSGTSRLAIPRLAIEQDARGDLRFTGLVSASGALPGGQISELQLPLQGRWSDARGLSIGESCSELRVGGLQLAGLDIGAQRLALCPAPGAAAMVRYQNSLEIAASTPRLAFAGRMGDVPVQLSAARALLRYPGPLALEGLDLRMGEGTAQTRLHLASLTGELGDAAHGQFAGGAGVLGEVPFALSDMAGRWRWAQGALRLEDANFILADRGALPARFEPLAGRAASLDFAEGKITALTGLYNPKSEQKIANLALSHDLELAEGAADFTVDRLTFGNKLDVEDLSYLAKGVIAFARGAVNGRGRIVWRGDNLSGEGRFSTDGLDFAAAFGPVRGLKGEIHFTDLINLTTAPDQRLEIAAINTGVEVLDGQVRYALRNGQIIDVADARFPFMGGELVMRPVTLDFSQPSEKRYIFDITALDAATFVAEMELTNLAVTGTFDGSVPIVFDASGNGRVENGVLRSRPPGGNVSYIGELSYEDMGAVSNYAFRALRSLDYREMGVVLDGSLTGEIISKFQFDGVRQGAGASRNFITRKLAQLPILFRVNVKSESFYELSTVVRSFFDASLLGNPMDRGLLRVENGRFIPGDVPAPVPPLLPQNDPPALRRDETLVQPPESDTQP